jgi:signal transduction histidine kinase
VLLHSSGKTKFKGGGPGLGLAIARGVVEAHQGSIWLESPGRDEKKFPGTTFFVRLPVSGNGRVK